MNPVNIRLQSGIADYNFMGIIGQRYIYNSRNSVHCQHPSHSSGQGMHFLNSSPSIQWRNIENNINGKHYIEKNKRRSV